MTSSHPEIVAAIDNLTVVLHSLRYIASCGDSLNETSDHHITDPKAMRRRIGYLTADFSRLITAMARAVLVEE